MTPEFSRGYPADTIGSAPRTVAIEAAADERGALARRFDLIALDRLTATATLVQTALGIEASGRFEATVIQTCVVTGDPVPAEIAEEFRLRFVDPALLASDHDEVELSDSDCDVMDLDGNAADLGEGVAQTLGLALDPFPRAASAEAQLRAAGIQREDEVRHGALSALRDLLGSPD